MNDFAHVLFVNYYFAVYWLTIRTKYHELPLMYVVKPLFIIYHLLNAERERERERERGRGRKITDTIRLILL
jgi:dolichol kinase